MRTLLSGILLAALGMTLTLSLAAAPAPATAGPATAAAAPSHVVVYYFHGNQRCRTCMKIESSTEQALRNRFPKQLQAKQVEWRVLNFDKPENEHVITDYGLVSQSVVLVEYRGGKEVRFKNLDKVWTFVHDDQAFEAYIRTELDAFLGAARG